MNHNESNDFCCIGQIIDALTRPQPRAVEQDHYLGLPPAAMAETAELANLEDQEPSETLPLLITATIADPASILCRRPISGHRMTLITTGGPNQNHVSRADGLGHRSPLRHVGSWVDGLFIRWFLLNVSIRTI